MIAAGKVTQVTGTGRWCAAIGLIAIAAVLVSLFSAGPARAAFGPESFDGEVLEKDGSASTQAGAHPYSASTDIEFRQMPDPEGGPFPIPDEQVKDIVVDLPPGLLGDPTSTPSKCTEEQLTQNIPFTNCPVSSQIGVTRVEFSQGFALKAPVYNMVAPPNQPALISFTVAGIFFHADIGLRSTDSYGVTVAFRGIPQTLPIKSTGLTLWGVPSDPSHDGERAECAVLEFGSCSTQAPPTPFLSNPTKCVPAGTGLETRLTTASWSGGIASAAFLSHRPAPEENVPVGPSGCEKVPFAPKADVQPTSSSAAASSGLDFELSVPQTSNPAGLVSSHLRRAEVTLPEGLTVNAAAAAGREGCSLDQIALQSAASPSCPEASRIGSVEVVTPLLEKPMSGSIYLAAQNANPFGGLMALYLVAEGPGVVVKLPGKVTLDERSGRLVTSFDDAPQLPFESLRVSLYGGQDAPLVAPAACGAYSSSYTLSSWSGKTVVGSSPFTIDQGCGSESKFTPGFQAGATNPIAGDHSPFTLRVTRPDGQQNVARIDATLPEGMLAKLAGVPLCPDSAAPSGNCPGASQVGTATVGVGAGGSPLYVPQPGKPGTAVYLAGPYKGAPYSLVAKVPAQAGPFDLGTVAVRSTIEVDPVTAQVSVKSDPLPQILQGVPIAYRDIRVDANRSQFTLNPTSCDPMEVRGTIGASGEAEARVSDRFQVASCERLGFKPALKLKVSGATKRSKYPAFRAELRAPAGQANIGKVSVALPRSEFLAQEHIRTICTRVKYAAKACPPGSVYGWARAFTPLLDRPLEGPVYLRSSSNPLPDLVASLDGQIHVDLAGRIDSVNGGIRTTFEGVPDAPVSKFVLSMKGGKKSLLVNSTNLCAATNRATVKLDGQNGKVHDFRPVVKNSCGKKAKKRAGKPRQK